MTNKNHYVSALLSGFTPVQAAIITTPDSMRCWSGDRALTHFTINPTSEKISFMTFPKESVKEWTEEMVKSAVADTGFNAGKPGVACLDEATIPSKMWDVNEVTNQNYLFYVHLVQDKSYDRFVRTFIDTSRMYENIFTFNGKEYSGDDLRGKGMARWNNDGLINQFDAQFYTRLAKRYFQVTGIKANTEWIENTMKPSVFEAYSTELAEKTVKYISINQTSEELITNCCFDYEVWPLPNAAVDKYIDWLNEDVLDCKHIKK